MQLSRVKVNDTFVGQGGQQGRILTNDAPFTLPLINDALQTMGRNLRNEGVKFPLRDNYIMPNVTALVQANPDLQIFIGYDGFFDGTVMHKFPFLPPDLMQPYELWEQNSGSGLPFQPMVQPEGGLPSIIQGPRLGIWEWRNYRIYMVGSTQTKNLRLKYKAGVPQYNVAPSAFATTHVGIADCKTALANRIEIGYGTPRGADPAALAACEKAAEDAESEMAAEYVRQQQTVVYRRKPYQEGGSGWNNSPQGGQGTII